MGIISEAGRNYREEINCTSTGFCLFSLSVGICTCMWAVMNLVTISKRRKKKPHMCFSFRWQGLMKVFHLHLSEFQDLSLPNLCDILFSLCCKALCPLVNKCNVSAIIFLLEENVVVRREKHTICSITYWRGNELWLKDALKIKWKVEGEERFQSLLEQKWGDGGSRWLACC